MKKFSFLIILMILSFFNLSSQVSAYIYSYDPSGNRISRELIILPEILKSQEVDNQSATDTTKLEYFAFGKSVRIYPNPTSDYLNIEISNLQIENNSTVIIYDTSGRILRKMGITDNNTVLNLSDISSGLYILQLIIGEHRKEWNILKK